MTREEFEHIVAEEFPRAVPARFQAHIKNVALLIEEEPSAHERAAQGLGPGETLLGLYKGISLNRRDGSYGIGGTLPDTITLYMNPIIKEAGGIEEGVRRTVRDTIWHEVAHYFGFEERDVEHREGTGTNFSKE